MGQKEDRELVPLKADFDVTWRGYRRSQVQFYMQQSETEIRMLTEDRDSALSQVEDLSAELDQARGEIEALRQQLDDACRTPIEEDALSDRLRRMVRLANDEATEVRASAQAAAEHEWARSEQSAAELRARYEALVAEADEWRRQAEQQRNEALARTREDIERMSREAEQHRRKVDTEAEQRRTQIEQDFEISMTARREEEMRGIAERERTSRQAAQRRVRAATNDAERRIRRADEYAATLLRLRQALAQRVRSAQQVLQAAEPFLAATEGGAAGAASDAYVGACADGIPMAEVEPVNVPRQRETEAESFTEQADTGAQEVGAQEVGAQSGEPAESGPGVTVATS